MKPGLIRKDTDVSRAMWRSMSAGARMAMIGLNLISPDDIPDGGPFGEAKAADVGAVERAMKDR